MLDHFLADLGDMEPALPEVNIKCLWSSSYALARHYELCAAWRMEYLWHGSKGAQKCFIPIPGYKPGICKLILQASMNSPAWLLHHLYCQNGDCITVTTGILKELSKCNMNGPTSVKAPWPAPWPIR